MKIIRENQRDKEVYAVGKKDGNRVMNMFELKAKYELMEKYNVPLNKAAEMYEDEFEDIINRFQEKYLEGFEEFMLSPI